MHTETLGAKRQGLQARTASSEAEPLPRGKGFGDGVTWADGVPSPENEKRLALSQASFRAISLTIIEPFLTICKRFWSL